MLKVRTVFTRTVGKQSLSKLISTLTLILCCTAAQTGIAEELTLIKGSGPLFTEVNNIHHENYSKILQALDDALPTIDFTYETKGLRRAIRDVDAGIIDFYYPFTCAELSGLREKNPSSSSPEPLGSVPFAIFSRKSNPVIKQDLDSAKYRLDSAFFNRIHASITNKERVLLSEITESFDTQFELFKAVHSALGRTLSIQEQQKFALASFPYIVETARSYLPNLSYPAQSDISPPNTLKKLNRRRIDAYIYPPMALEQYITEDLFSRDLYKVEDLCAYTADTVRGNRVERTLSEAFRALKENGRYQEVFGEADRQEEVWIQRHKKW